MIKTRLPSLARRSATTAMFLALALGSFRPTAAQAPGRAAATAGSGRSSLVFIENTGQFAAGARFQAWGGGCIRWLAEDALWLAQFDGSAEGLPVAASHRAPLDPWSTGARGVNIKLSFPGANPHPRLEPFDRLPARVSFFKGSDPDQWRAGVPAWGGVRYVELYPGIDLELAGDQGQLVPRLVARPGADVGAVRLRVEGAEAVTVEGEVIRLRTAAGEAAWPLLRAPGVTSEPVVRPRGAGTFEVATPFAPEERGAAGAAVGHPGLLFGTLFGGSSGDWGQRIALDGSGAVYVAGVTQSTDLPSTPGAIQEKFGGEHDAFVLKLAADGSALEYATFLGGDRGDPAHGLAVDASGAAYVAGHTESDNFPTTPGAYQPSSPGGDAFAVKLSADGSALQYATYLGGSSNYEGALGIALLESGAVALVGVTGSPDFPVTEGAFDTVCGTDGLCNPDASDPDNPAGDAFVVRLSPDGSMLEYATFLGGGSPEWSTDIAADEAGAAYVTGHTASSDFPTTQGASDTDYGGGSSDAFVAKLDPGGSQLSYSTFVGGSAADSGQGLTLDVSGAAYVAGYSYSSDMPTTPGAYDRTLGDGNAGYGDAFVVKLNAAGTELEYATFLGGSGDDGGEGIVVDASGAASLTGKTYSADFPATADAFAGAIAGALDAFVARLDPGGSSVEYATFLGGSALDWGYDIAVSSGRAYVAGTTSSADFPTTPGALDTTYNGDPGDAFVVKLVTEGGFGYVVYLPLVVDPE